MRNEATSETSCETCMWPATLISRAQLLRSSTPSEEQSENYTNEQFFVAGPTDSYPVRRHSRGKFLLWRRWQIKARNSEISRERHGNHERRWCLKFMLKSRARQMDYFLLVLSSLFRVLFPAQRKTPTVAISNLLHANKKSANIASLPCGT